MFLILVDATKDDRFEGNPLVTGKVSFHLLLIISIKNSQFKCTNFKLHNVGAPHIRFYGGAPLVTREGLALGSLCAIHSKPVKTMYL